MRDSSEALYRRVDRNRFAGREQMRSLKPGLIVAALVLSLLASGMVFADRSSGGRGYKGGHYRGGHKSYYYRGGHRHYRSGVDVVIGGSFWGPPWYYPPYSYYRPYSYPYYYPYSYAPVVEVPSEPPVYIERSQPDSSPLPNVWFYCPESKTYYPYVKECSGGWQTVPAEPPAEQGR